MLGGNKRKMKNQGGNPMRNNIQRKNFQQQNFNASQLNDQGYVDFSTSFNEPQQQSQQQSQQAPRQQNQMNNNKRKNLQNQRRPNPKKNFNNQNGAGNQNWQNQPPQRRVPPMNQQQPNQFLPFNQIAPPMMNQRNMPGNFRNNNARNGMSMPPMMRPGGGGPMMNRPMPPMPPRGGGGPMRRQFPKFNNNANNNNKNNNQNRKNPNLTKVNKPKNRKLQNIKRNGNKGKKRPRDPYSLEAPFVTDEIKAEHAKKEEIFESMKGKGKNDELFAKFKEQREIFVKKYDEAKAAYQAEKKAQREAAKAAKAENANADNGAPAPASSSEESPTTEPTATTENSTTENSTTENPATESSEAMNTEAPVETPAVAAEVTGQA